jgi:GntR family transcriptional regulator of gluconate operon
LNKFAGTAIQREALGSRVATELRIAIAAGEFVQGERLIEVDLAAHFGVSRGPIRDAFRILAAEGLIEPHQPGSGMVVTGIDQDSIIELYSLRGAIEGLAIRLAVARYDESQMQSIEQLVAQMDRAALNNDPSAFALADIAFHNEICRLSGHKRLTDVWRQYEGIMMTLLRLTISLDQNLKSSTQAHRLLLDLMRGGDEEAAAQELLHHLDRSKQRMIKVWEKALERRRNSQSA